MGLVEIFGGDGMAVFAQCRMTPDQFAGEGREEIAALVAALAEADGWARAEQALYEGDQAFAAYGERVPLEEIVFGLHLTDLSGTPPVQGYTGFGGIPGWIITV
jgi:ABC-type nitrate/sulfonate/bicarbonate transport system substrate-binding protein